MSPNQSCTYISFLPAGKRICPSIFHLHRASRYFKRRKPSIPCSLWGTMHVLLRAFLAHNKVVFILQCLNPFFIWCSGKQKTSCSQRDGLENYINLENKRIYQEILWSKWDVKVTLCLFISCIKCSPPALLAFHENPHLRRLATNVEM